VIKSTPLLLVLGLAVPGTAQDLEPVVFPSKVGRIWTYVGRVRWTPPGSERLVEREVTWPVEVVDLVERGPVRAIFLRGHPDDLIWFEEGRTPGDHAIVRVEGDGLWHVEGERVEELRRHLADSTHSFVDLLREGEKFLDLPLRVGSRACGPDQVAREDGFYCWIVESVKTADTGSVEGMPPGDRAAYRLALRTIGEHRLVDLVPGVGIVGYVFSHHGSVSDVELRLAEVRPPVPGVEE
jgi:hypothetical protein